jgi:hypothetical protein
LTITSSNEHACAFSKQKNIYKVFLQYESFHEASHDPVCETSFHSENTWMAFHQYGLGYELAVDLLQGRLYFRMSR